jgi:hypothetical protein
MYYQWFYYCGNKVLEFTGGDRQSEGGLPSGFSIRGGYRQRKSHLHMVVQGVIDTKV